MSFLNTVTFLQAQAQPQGGLLFSFAPLLFMVVIFYFLLIRPQQKRQKQHNTMLTQLKKGDKVLTSGGIYGLIERVREDGVLVVKVADNVKVEMAKSAVSTVVKGSGEAQEAEAKK